MKWFLDLTTRSKLFTGFGLMIVFLAIVMATAYFGITAIQSAQRNLYQEDFANAVDLMFLRSDENGARAALLSMMSVTRDADRETWQQEVKSLAEQSRQATAQVRTILGDVQKATSAAVMAMENIKQTSVQNVAGTKQAETAAQSLHELGQKLKQLAAQYKV